MLTCEERRRILRLWRHFSKFTMFPITVDPECWELRAGSVSRWKTWALRGSFLLFTAHALYINLSLALALLSHRPIPLHKMIMHGNMAAASATFSFWYYVLYLKHPDLNALLAGMTLTGNVAGPPGKWERKYLRLQERSLQDLLGLLMPVGIPLSAGVVGVCILFDPMMKFVLYSALPEQFQNWLSFVICYVEEIRFLYMFAAIIIPIWQVQLLAFDLINDKLEEIVDAVSTA